MRWSERFASRSLNLSTMSEKASLLSNVPPVGKSASTASKSSVPELPDPDTKKTEAPRESPNSIDRLMAPTDSQTNQRASRESGSPSHEVEPTEAVAVVDATPDPAQAGVTITPLQNVTYYSLVVTSVMAGLAAVILFRKATKLAEQRFAESARTLGIGFILIAMHGFFVSHQYSGYLNERFETAPLLIGMAVWILVGPVVAAVLNNLLTPGKQAETKHVLLDAVCYVVIFTLSMFALHPGITTNGGLLFALAAGFLFIVPAVRHLSVFRLAKARHPELRQSADQVLIYSLLFIPALLPVLAFACVCGLDADLVQFLMAFVTFDFVLVAGIAMITAADELTEEASAARTSAVAEQGVPPPQEDDPNMAAAAKPTKAAPSAQRPTKRPPKKPARVAGSGGAAAAPNEPSRIKAPSKPKKRF